MLLTTRRLVAPVAAAAAAVTIASDAGPTLAAEAVTIQASGQLNARSAPTSASALTRKLDDGATLVASCKVTGRHIRGTVRATAQWNRLTGGDYVSHAYVVGNPRLPTCAGPAVTAARAESTPTSEPHGAMTDAQFIEASADRARRNQREHGVPSSVTVAQAILESGWGRSALAHFDRNFFGIKCFTPGPYAVGCRARTTAECTPTGACFSTDAVFRTYASASASFRDHGLLLATSPRYRTAFSYRDDPNRFVLEIHRAGYATDPFYTDKVAHIIAKYGLRRFDRL